MTVTGQLCILMLIEQLRNKVISANTDGITVFCDRSDQPYLEALIEWWEKLTGFAMEWTEYKALYRQDISNYIAVKKDGGIKAKGRFGKVDLKKNPVNRVCYLAVNAFVEHGTPVEESIFGCNNIHDFLTLRTVNGGAVKDGVEYGKSVRWYRSTATDTAIYYKTNGNKVPDSDNGALLMDIPNAIPEDLDFLWYINKAKEILDGIGA